MFRYLLTAPHAARLTLKLEGTLEDFNGDAFVRETAEALGVNPADIVLTDVRKGSIIVDVCEPGALGYHVTCRFYWPCGWYQKPYVFIYLR